MELMSPDPRGTPIAGPARANVPKVKLAFDDAVAEMLLIPLYARALETR
jgi:hypothetical protein